jgi:hypothetical protein
LTIPLIKKTFVFDETESAKVGRPIWHERAYLNNGVLESHRSSFHVMAFGKNYVFWTGDNSIYELSNDYYSDAGSAIKRIRTGAHVSNENKRIRINKFELEFERGQGLTNDQGSSPMVFFRQSGDGGFSWSGEEWRSLGKIGEYDQRAEWRAQGVDRDWVFEVSVSDPVKANIIGAYIEAEPWRN